MRLPYYVLLVGGPEEIPWQIQHGLDSTYAVGRIYFDDPEGYAHYARSVVDAEERRLRLPRRAAFFAPQHAGDRATLRTRRDLVEPLADHVAAKARGWQVDRACGPDAGKATLARWAAGADTPALLFTGGHGMVFPAGHPDQLRRQGSLVTSDWQGKDTSSGPRPQHCFAADDLKPEDAPAGMVAFLFACYGAGTPLTDSFWQRRTPAPQISEQPFVAALAKDLLGRRDGALAVLGHVDRAWTTSFDWFGDGRQRLTYETILDCLLDGKPVGMAMEYLGQFAGDMGSELSDLWTLRHQRRAIDPEHFARLWTAQKDAANFVVFGDPAVRLAV